MHEIRRADRAIGEEEARLLLDGAEYGVLSTAGPDGQPYGLPINFCVLDGDIYFHCAVEGHKIDNIERNPRVSFCVVGKTCVLPGRFSTEYESAIAFGRVEEVFDAEKQAGLEGLLRKYSADHFGKGLKYIESLNWKTRVYRVVVEAVSGKARR